MRTLVALLALASSAPAQDGGKIAWRGKSDDPKAAIADARRANRPLMLFFTSVG